MLMLVSAAGYTQENDPHLPVFEFGPKLGVNITKIDGQPFKQEFNYGYSAGLFAALKLAKTGSWPPKCCSTSMLPVQIPPSAISSM